ncbi:hypothetical protein HYS72_03615 [Candidatus Pacearchaeota archaeon]|nr:hypothetical protein [Candidatus Pacearchaeota archaeon]MBI2056755.1 hypothetical protein [Candidatus Pacearchaeota archaeon]
MKTKIMSIFLLGILMTSFMAAGVLAQDSNPEKNVCMKDAVQKKNIAFKEVKTIYLSALDQAKLIQDEGDRKEARAQARVDLKTGLKNIKITFKSDREACLAPQ